MEIWIKDQGMFLLIFYVVRLDHLEGETEDN